jgi:hypothetical protein
VQKQSDVHVWDVHRSSAILMAGANWRSSANQKWANTSLSFSARRLDGIN